MEPDVAFAVFPVGEVVEEEVDGFVVCFGGCDEEQAGRHVGCEVEWTMERVCE